MAFELTKLRGPTHYGRCSECCQFKILSHFMYYPNFESDDKYCEECAVVEGI